MDTYAWVEYFKGTSKGEKVKKILIESTCFASAISLAELSEWCAKNALDSGKIICSAKKLSIMLPLEEDILEAAGKINFQKKKEIKGFGLVDAIILATAIAHNLRFVTGDKHFAK